MGASFAFSPRDPILRGRLPDYPNDMPGEIGVAWLATALHVQLLQALALQRPSYYSKPCGDAPPAGDEPVQHIEEDLPTGVYRFGSAPWVDLHPRAETNAHAEGPTILQCPRRGHHSNYQRLSSG